MAQQHGKVLHCDARSEQLDGEGVAQAMGPVPLDATASLGSRRTPGMRAASGERLIQSASTANEKHARVGGARCPGEPAVEGAPRDSQAGAATASEDPPAAAHPELLNLVARFRAAGGTRAYSTNMVLVKAIHVLCVNHSSGERRVGRSAGKAGASIRPWECQGVGLANRAGQGPHCR